MEKEYRTIAHAAQSELEEKRSRFLGYIHPVASEEEALAFLETIRARHWDARHNVYAYRLREGGRSRFSDDGEPQGTAGMPVLEVLQKRELFDCIVVVTRYFGGILLGTGGLVRAYSQAASLAVDAAGGRWMRPCALCCLECDYADYGRISSLIPEWEGRVDDTQFAQYVTLAFRLPQAAMERGFERALADATGGRVECRVTGEGYLSVDAEAWMPPT